MDDTINTADIAALLGCSREHVTDRVVKERGFPAPRVNLSQKLRRWDREEVLHWIEQRSKKAA